MLFDNRCVLKLTDFGSAEWFGMRESGTMSEVGSMSKKAVLFDLPSIIDKIGFFLSLNDDDDDDDDDPIISDVIALNQLSMYQDNKKWQEL
ncbi:hypothetical protein Tco_0357624 [Tanacetum coccineum]